MNALNNIPSRIKYYLLDYKDRNMEDYRSTFGTKGLNDLNLNELKHYFNLATNKDLKKFLTDLQVTDIDYSIPDEKFYGSD